MLAIATNLGYYSNNEIIIDSDYNDQFKFEIVKQYAQDDQNSYPCDNNPIAIKMDNGRRKLKISLTKQEANEFIRLLTKAL